MYLPACSISQVWARNIRTYLARIPTREYQDMNLPAHTITCSPPSMNLPTHGTTSPVQVSHHCVQTTHTSYWPQHYRLAQPKCYQAKLVQTAWRNILVASRQAPDSPNVLGSVAWRNIPCRQAPRGAGTSLEVLSPNTNTRAARRYTSSDIYWFSTPKQIGL